MQLVKHFSTSVIVLRKKKCKVTEENLSHGVSFNFKARVNVAERRMRAITEVFVSAASPETKGNENGAKRNQSVLR